MTPEDTLDRASWCWLKDRVIELERDLAALGPWTVQTLRQYVADTSAGFECETGCDSYGHTECCPVTNTVAAFRLLRERLAVRDERIRELERANKEGWETATQENDVAFQAVQRILDLEHEVRSACQALQDEENENERLEQQLKAAQATIEQGCGIVDAVDEDIQSLEGQLKATQERLAEAEALLRLFVWRRSKVIGCTSAQHGETINATKEYFAKHSPSPEEHP